MIFPPKSKYWNSYQQKTNSRYFFIHE
jgi:hypothetical protein